ncbi:hypothetical protein VNO77_34416 [Canavalia gladiata]|uniref:Uncharacterized protein n=1 Tax=Canavalia gladiata TaxID=3824 RepID=A0AAN9KG47_CANGL
MSHFMTGFGAIVLFQARAWPDAGLGSFGYPPRCLDAETVQYMSHFMTAHGSLHDRVLSNHIGIAQMKGFATKSAPTQVFFYSAWPISTGVLSWAWETAGLSLKFGQSSLSLILRGGHSGGDYLSGMQRLGLLLAYGIFGDLSYETHSFWEVLQPFPGGKIGCERPLNSYQGQKLSPLTDRFNLSIPGAWCLMLLQRLGRICVKVLETEHLIRKFDRLVTEASSHYPKAAEMQGGDYTNNRLSQASRPDRKAILNMSDSGLQQAHKPVAEKINITLWIDLIPRKSGHRSVYSRNHHLRLPANGIHFTLNQGDGLIFRRRIWTLTGKERSWSYDCGEEPLLNRFSSADDPVIKFKNAKKNSRSFSKLRS